MSRNTLAQTTQRLVYGFQTRPRVFPYALAGLFMRLKSRIHPSSWLLLGLVVVSDFRTWRKSSSVHRFFFQPSFRGTRVS